MLIGLSGRAGSGKDTVFDIINAAYAGRAERRKFAGPLYQSAAEALGLSVDQLDEWKRDPAVSIRVVREGGYLPETLAWISPRRYLQRYGTEAHREIFGRDFWIKAADLSHSGKVAVFTDVRFPNEAWAIREAGGHVVEVVGPQDAGAQGHDSELSLPWHLIHHRIDNTIRTDGMESLRAQVLSVLDWIIDETHGEAP